MSREASPLLYLALGAAGVGAAYWAYQGWKKGQRGQMTTAIDRKSAKTSTAAAAPPAAPSPAQPAPTPSPATQPVKPQPLPEPLPVPEPPVAVDTWWGPPEGQEGSLDWPAPAEPVDPRQLQDAARFFGDVARIISFIPGAAPFATVIGLIGRGLGGIAEIGQALQPQPQPVGEDNWALPGYTDWLAQEKGYGEGSDWGSYDPWSGHTYETWDPWAWDSYEAWDSGSYDPWVQYDTGGSYYMV